MSTLRILGIETSCDETAAAIYQQGKGILANVLYSQTDLHKTFGGVVPELASRAHLEIITSIIDRTLADAAMSLNDIDVIAVTNTPGLPGSLLVGMCFAKAIAWSHHKKLIGVNHLEAHAFSPCIEHDVPFPHLCLTASGGHTSLYFIQGFGDYQAIGTTLDDAAGEAFDKVAKLIKLPYPGGPVIEQLAASVNFEDFFSYPRQSGKTLDFSFSGLKTAVLYDLVKRSAYDMQTKVFLKEDDALLKTQVASSMLVCVADTIINKLKLALNNYPQSKAITFAGGVACNAYIRNRLRTFCEKQGIRFITPSPRYCTDNAAMIAFVGSYKAAREEFNSLELDIHP